MEQIINIDRMEHAAALFGSFDSNIKIIEDEFNVRVHARDSELKISGDAEGVLKASKVIDSLLSLLNRGEQLSEQNITYCISLVNEGSEEKVEALASDCVCVTSKGKPIKPKTHGQKRYCTAIEENTITIAVGPAGTGKTYLAVAMAVTAFRSKEVNRIILTRPAVEAGEKLGFCPAICKARSTRICVLCMTRCSICWERKPTRSTWSAVISRSLRWRICAAERSTTALSFWTRRRILPPNR